MQRASVLTVALCLVTSPLALAGGERWIHIRIHDPGGRGDAVSIDVPLRVVEELLPSVAGGDPWSDELNLSFDSDDEGIDLRSIVVALRDAPDSEFLTVQGRDGSLRVAKDRGYLRLDVDDDGDRVRIRLPLPVAEALVAGDGDDLDLGAGLRAIARLGDTELLTLESDDTSIRIWVD